MECINFIQKKNEENVNNMTVFVAKLMQFMFTKKNNKWSLIIIFLENGWVDRFDFVGKETT